MYQVNEVVSLNGELYRILLVELDFVVWISLDDKKAFPTQISAREIESLVLDEKLFKVDDPYAYLALLAPEQGSKDSDIRDKNFEIIRPLIEDDYFFLPKVRAKCARLVLEKGLVSKPYYYKLIRQYWQRGQMPNALLPDYRNSGGKGKKRSKAEHKLGRPRTSKPGTGAIIDEQTEKLFRSVIDKYLLKESAFSLAYAHRRLKLLYDQLFPDTPESEKPTKRQLGYFYNREYTHAEKILSTTNYSDYQSNYRPVRSSAAYSVLLEQPFRFYLNTSDQRIVG